MAQHWRAKPTGGIARGIAIDGAPLLSYGFRPFFLAAGLFAPLAMMLWLGALIGGWEIGGSSHGPVNWHAHEMLFGYTTAALTGFLLTTIPNWTGRLPVSGGPLLALALLWLAGRVAMAAPDVLGPIPSAIIDSAFLPVILLIALREIVAGKNWRNLKIIAGLGALAGINIASHAAMALGGEPALFYRAAIAVYICLIGLVGGRIVPSFTRNWLVKVSAKHLPAPFDRFDAIAMIVLIVAAACWTILPDSPLSAALIALAAGLHLVRLLRWRGANAIAEPMLVVLHVGYAFIPLGLAAVTASALGWITTVSALHLLTVGAIGNMTLAVMTRATMGHTGRPIQASRLTVAAFVAIFVAAAIRPLAELVPDYYFVVLGTSGGAWIVAFLLFCIEFGPMLLGPKLQVSPPRPGRVPAPARGGPAIAR
jgi:uncharacterized protein involved in response to NO